MPRKYGGPELRKVRGRPFWHIFYKEFTGLEDQKGAWKRISTGTNDKAEANGQLQDFIDGLETPTVIEKDDISQILTAYRLFRRDEYKRKKVQERNYRVLEGHLKHVEAFFGGKRVGDIDRSLCRGYWQKRMDIDGVQRSTVTKELTLFTAALNHAVKEKWILRAPYIDKPGHNPPRDYVPEAEDIIKAISLCPEPHVRAYMTIAYCTGAREGAILSLTWDRVDFDNRLIKFVIPAEDETKKRKSIAKMNNTIERVLRNVFAIKTTEYVVEFRGKPLSRIDQGVRRAGKRVGIKLSPHVLKHAAVTHMAQKGVSFEEISAMTATSVKTLRKNYLKYTPDFLKNAAGAMEFDF